jgi:hypothetical protein
MPPWSARAGGGLLIPTIAAIVRPRPKNPERLPPETERDLHDAGLFDWIVQPKRVGCGSELDYVALIDVLMRWAGGCFRGVEFR